MKAIYQSRYGNTFATPLEALYDDATTGSFTMYDKAGNVTADLNECNFVFIANSKGIEDFDQLREDWRRWMCVTRNGDVNEGFCMWDECEGCWSDPIPRGTFAAIAANVLQG